MKKLSILALLLLFSNSCSNYRDSFWNKVFPLPNPKLSELSRDQIMKMVIVEKSDFDHLINYIAPTLSPSLMVQKNTIRVSDGPNITIRGWKNKKNENAKSHQVYVQINYTSSAWHHYNLASDNRAKTLPLTKIDSSVASCSRYKICSHSETIGINISDDYLRSAKDDGIKLRLSAKSGDREFASIPSEYIGGYLEKFDQLD